jgi:hypothetical protein
MVLGVLEEGFCWAQWVLEEIVGLIVGLIVK